MKKFFTFIISLTALLTVTTGCGSKKSSAKVSDSALDSVVEQNSEQSSTQPVPTDHSQLTTAANSSKTNKNNPTTTTATAEKTPTDPESPQPVTIQKDPLNNDSFSYDDDGAVIFTEDPAAAEDDVLMAAAKALYGSACHTQWDFTVGCPYNIDSNDFIETELNWRFYRITDSDITSLADVEHDYYKVFSSRYSNTLSEIYIDGDGSVYALNGARGSNIYYIGSEITEIQSKTDDEIFFTVENHYSGDDFHTNEPVTRTETFSVVIEGDGTWRAGQFTLPY